MVGENRTNLSTLNNVIGLGSKFLLFSGLVMFSCLERLSGESFSLSCIKSRGVKVCVVLFRS